MTAPSRWQDLRRFTTARVALGRAGHGLPTAAHLDFQAAHAAARDAVWSALDTAALARALAAEGFAAPVVASEAPDRRTYLLRPDLGRRLRAADRARLEAAAMPGGCAIVLADGLCARGVQAEAPGLLRHLRDGLAGQGWPPPAIVIATEARVALGDEIGEALGAAVVLVLIGERPGLSALDSVGAYLTWAPRRGRTDAERNCVSNIRPAGLPAAEAAAKLLWLVAAARRRGGSGVLLKEEAPATLAAPPAALADR